MEETSVLHKVAARLCALRQHEYCFSSITETMKDVVWPNVQVRYLGYVPLSIEIHKTSSKANTFRCKKYVNEIARTFFRRPEIRSSRRSDTSCHRYIQVILVCSTTISLHYTSLLLFQIFAAVV